MAEVVQDARTAVYVDGPGILAPQLLKICANPETLTWSVILEDGTDYWELEEVYINVPLAGRVDAKADNDTRPSMWLECFGRLRVENQVAYIEGS